MKSHNILSAVIFCFSLLIQFPSRNIRPKQVIINEILLNPTDGTEWVKLYNKIDKDLDISGCHLDDRANCGGRLYRIPDSTIVPAKGFYVAEFRSYYNNTGDDVRFLGMKWII